MYEIVRFTVKICENIFYCLKIKILMMNHIKVYINFIF